MALKAEIERPRNIRLSPEPIAFYAYMSANEPNPSLNHALIFDVIETNVEEDTTDSVGYSRPLVQDYMCLRGPYTQEIMGKQVFVFMLITT